MSISSIDDLLMGGKTPQHPETPENQYLDEPEEIEELEPETPDYGVDEPEEDHTNESDEASDLDDEPEDKHPKDFDEYGNEKPKPRMYTEEEHKELVSKAIRERLERFQRNNPDAVVQQPTPQQIQQQTKGFEFDPESEQSLPQQLERFIESTVSNMTNKREEQARMAKEQEIQAEFEEKFASGMNKFNDFRDVMTSLPFEITNPMTLATRAMADPAAFLYAAAKRQPQELERISKIRDPYAQMTEMGKLEERMRRNKPTTKAPRPLGRTTEDATTPTPKKKTEPSIEDLIAKADAKKLGRIKGRQGGRR